jgi:hypothetical protein
VAAAPPPAHSSGRSERASASSRCRRGGNRLVQQVGRHIDEHGTLRRGGGQSHGLRRDRLGLFGAADAEHALGEALEDRGLVGRSVHPAEAAALGSVALGDLGGDEHHGDAARCRFAECTRRVRSAGPGDRERGGGAPGAAGYAVGRVHGGLLVAHPDDLNPVAFPRGLPETEVVHARDAERDLDPVVDEHVDDRLCDGAFAVGSAHWRVTHFS